MIFGILGGTGKEGTGLALRLAKAGHAVVLGSRDGERARAKATELAAAGQVEGGTNREAAERGEVVIVAVPFAGHRALLEELRDQLRSKIVVDTVVPLDFKARHTYAPPPEGSAAEEAQAVLGEGARVVAALHQIAAHDLASDRPIEADGLYAGDDAGAKERVAELVRALGCRPVDAGPLKNAPILESITPLLIEINKRHKTKSSGIRITGI